MAQIFRVERTKNFTVMSNHHFKNKNLTLKAKGLLSLMLSLPDDWYYNMQGLATLSSDGIDSVRSAIKELKHHGYVERHRLGEKEKAKASRLLTSAVDGGYIKVMDPDTAPRYKKYIPYWA